ncbi:hypothetical protein GGR42_001375 [Saonia flava]|uniref:FecR family protein n=1 Tax=Saonia flava TaxID=523696 RepID=A0A846QXF3_9FLAO|nr:FecR family protein [Saonia flava]NJB70913.1 hypothetical protein [Saonia flava]
MEKIFIKYLTNSISSPELDKLSKWAEEHNDENEFETYVKINYAISNCMSEYNLEESKKALLKKIRKDKNILYRLNFNSFLKYAAIAILFIGVGYIFQQNFNRKDKVVPTEGMVTLQLENGSVEVLPEYIEESTGNLKEYKVSGTNGEGSTVQSKKLVFNTLKVPYGKKFKVVLADGTKVHLNSGTSLKYPIGFINGKNREVFLNGEAYFDVAKDAKNPFIVHTNEVNVRVVGTQFVISSYPEDTNINTVLVEGSVGLFKKGEEFSVESASMLDPGHKATWNKVEKNISIEEVNTSDYTEWMNGKVVFNHMAFKDILKKLERHYDVSITNYNKQLDEEQFTASFDTETIEEVLSAFNINYSIDYQINDNEILIN